MKPALYRIFRSLFLVQQRWADRLRAPVNGRSRNPVEQAWILVVGFFLDSVRRVVKPATRNRFRIWLTRLSMNDGPQRQGTPGGAVIGDSARQGVNIIGYIKGELGLGEAARSTIRAMKAAGIDFVGVDVGFGCSSRREECVDESILGRPTFAVNLFHLNADQLYVAYNYFTRDFFSGRRNILYCVWEQAELPEDWVPAFDLVDEIWTASGFCQDVISRKVVKPVVRIPHNVRPDDGPFLDRSALGLPESPFVFLAMADFFSVPERKNPLGCLEAYSLATDRGLKDAVFVLKTTNQDSRSDVKRSIAALAKKCGSIILMDGYMTRPEVNSLIKACDCFVSLHRAEGFGLPIAEAMYMGKPVIATGWSGNMDYMNGDNSFPVRYSLRGLEYSSGPYRKGGVWAEPDLDHAADLMFRVRGNRGEASARGALASRDIKRDYSPEVVGRLIRDRLNRARGVSQ